MPSQALSLAVSLVLSLGAEFSGLLVHDEWDASEM